MSFIHGFTLLDKLKRRNMKTIKNKIRILFFSTLTISCIGLSRAQITCAFPIVNNSPCDVYVGFEIYDAACSNCGAGPALLIPKGGNPVFVGGSCCPLGDIFVVLNQVENCAVVGNPTADVGDPA